MSFSTTSKHSNKPLYRKLLSTSSFASWSFSRENPFLTPSCHHGERHSTLQANTAEDSQLWLEVDHPFMTIQDLMLMRGRLILASSTGCGCGSASSTAARATCPNCGKPDYTEPIVHVLVKVAKEHLRKTLLHDEGDADSHRIEIAWKQLREEYLLLNHIESHRESFQARHSPSTVKQSTSELDLTFPLFPLSLLSTAELGLSIIYALPSRGQLLVDYATLSAWPRLRASNDSLPQNESVSSDAIASDSAATGAGSDSACMGLILLFRDLVTHLQRYHDLGLLCNILNPQHIFVSKATILAGVTAAPSFFFCFLDGSVLTTVQNSRETPASVEISTPAVANQISISDSVISKLNLASSKLIALKESGASQRSHSWSEASVGNLLDPSNICQALYYVNPDSMNLRADIRSDLYSLGCMMYHILVGYPPFADTANQSTPTENEALFEIVHCHLAKEPTHPTSLIAHGSETSIDTAASSTTVSKPVTIVDSIRLNDQQASNEGSKDHRPVMREAEIRFMSMIEAITMKLLSKLPEARYQSCRGLLKDLQYCEQLLFGPCEGPGQLDHCQFDKRIANLTKLKINGTNSNYHSEDVLLSEFRISESLYGREIERKQLIDAFDDLCSDSENDPARPALILLSGHSGVGKTMLVDSVRRMKLQSHILFAQRKFDLLQRGSSAVIQALQQLVLRVLTKPQEEQQKWRNNLLKALGSEAQIMVEMIPPLRTLLGPQQPVPALPTLEAERRLQLQVVAFIQVFATAEHPVVLFIDDLQWCDLQALALLKILVNMQQKVKHEDVRLLVIGAYRDNELSKGHPLATFIADIEEDEPDANLFAETKRTQVASAEVTVAAAVAANAASVGSIAGSSCISDSIHQPANSVAPLRVLRMQLKPMSLNDITQLVVDTLHCEMLEPLPSSTVDSFESGGALYAMPLSRYIFSKTGGNGFFVNQIFHWLHSQGCFWMDFDARPKPFWRYDLKIALELPCCKDIMNLMNLQLQRLSTGAMSLLSLASCLGHEFAYDSLLHARVFQAHESFAAMTATVAKQVWELIFTGFLVTVNAETSHRVYELAFPSGTRLLHPKEEEQPCQPIILQFLHDRVQQSAYSLLAKDEASKLHLMLALSSLTKLHSSGVFNLLEVEQVSAFSKMLGLDRNSNTSESSSASISAVPMVKITIPTGNMTATSASIEPSTLFEIVSHFEKCFELLTDQDLLRKVVLICLRASSHAKHSVAYDSALRFAQFAKRLIDEKVPHAWFGPSVDHNWQGLQATLLQLAVSASFMTAEAQFLQSNYKECIKIIECVLTILATDLSSTQSETETVSAKTASPMLDSRRLCIITLRELLAQATISENRYADSLAISFETLKLLHFNLPDSKAVEAIFENEIEFFRQIEVLIEQAPSASPNSPRDYAVAHVLADIATCSYFLLLDSYVPVCCAMLTHALQTGPTSKLAFGLTCFQHVCHEYQKLALCERVSRLAIQLSEKYGVEGQSVHARCVSSYGVAVCFWIKPMAMVVPYLNEANNMCMQAGDLEYVGYTCMFGLDALLLSGRAPLESVQQRQVEALALFRKKKLPVATMYLRMWRVCIAKLLGVLGPEEEQLDLDGEGSQISQADILGQQLAIHAVPFLFACYTAEITFAYMSRQFERAIPLGKAAFKLPKWKRIGLITVPHAVFYYALAMLGSINQASYPTARETEALELPSSSCDNNSRFVYATRMHQVQLRLNDIHRWAQFAACNYLHKWELLEAERMQAEIFLGDPSDNVVLNNAQPLPTKVHLVYPCLQLYQSAIARASAQQFTHDDMLANELCGRFLLKLGFLNDSAASYIRNAFLLAARWGCVLKCKQLSAQFPQLMKSTISNRVSYEAESGYKSDTADVVTSDERMESSQLLEESSIRATEPMLTPTWSPGDGTPASFSTPESSSSSSRDIHSIPMSSFQLTPETPNPLRSPNDSAATGRTTPNVDRLDFHLVQVAMMKACIAFSVETDLTCLLDRIMSLVLTYSHATKAVLLLNEDEPAKEKFNESPLGNTLKHPILSEWKVKLIALENGIACDAEVGSLPGQTPNPIKQFGPLLPTLESGTVLPIRVFNYVLSTRSVCMLTASDIKQHGFYQDPYIQRVTPTTILMLPIVSRSAILGMLYLENEHQNRAFNSSQIYCLQLISAQAALSIENARINSSLQASKEEAQRSAQIKSDFINTMSHEIRTPLNAIIGLTRLLLLENPTLDQTTLLHLVQSSSNLLLGIISDILDFSRLDTGKMPLAQEPLRLYSTIEQTVQQCSEIASQKGLELAYVIDSECPAMILADKQHLQQVIVNLLSNAIKFCEQGFVTVKVRVTQEVGPQEAVLFAENESGRLFVDAHRITTSFVPSSSAKPMETMLSGPEANEINPSSTKITTRPSASEGNSGANGLYLSVAVHDTGSGVPVEILPKLFQPFSQGDSSIRRKYGGTGLGLAICKRLIEAMDGHIWVTNTQNQGLTASFVIPLRIPIAPHFPKTCVQGSNIFDLPTDDFSRAQSILLICCQKQHPGMHVMLSALLQGVSTTAAKCWAVEGTADLRESSDLTFKVSESTTADNPSLVVVNSVTEAGEVWRARKSRATDSPFSSIVVVNFDRSTHKTCLDSLLSSLDRPSECSYPLRIAIIGSRWTSVEQQQQPQIVNPVLEAQPAPAHPRPIWPDLHVQQFFTPFPQYDLLYFLLRLETSFKSTSMRGLDERTEKINPDTTATEKVVNDAFTKISDSVSLGRKDLHEVEEADNSQPRNFWISDPTSYSIFNPPTATVDQASTLSTEKARSLQPDSQVSVSGESAKPLQLLPANSFQLLREKVPFRLLLVEDNIINIKLMKLMCAKLGRPITEGSEPPSIAFNGVQCLQTIEQLVSKMEQTSVNVEEKSNQFEHLPQVLLMDVSMDQMDGLECTSIIRARYNSRYAALNLPPPYIIACTANVSQDNMKACAASGMDDFLGKPISLEKLGTALTKAGVFLQKSQVKQK